jgi:chlorophyll synthase
MAADVRFGVKALDLFFLIRPPLLIASSAFFFAGAVEAVGLRNGIYGMDAVLRLLPGLLLYLMAVSASFIVNQVLDIESDRLNRKNLILPSGLVSRRESIALVIAVCLLAAVGAALIGGRMALLVWAGLGLGMAYSVPPLRLKGRPVADAVANVGGFGVIAFMMGWLAASGSLAGVWIRALPYALAMGGIFMNTCIPDEEGDRMAGDRTSCVVFGRRFAGLAGLALTGGAATAGLASGQVLVTLAVTSSLPGMVAVAVEPTSRNSVVASQFAARTLFVLLSIKVPLLALLGLLAVLASRVYYSRRFGLVYPRLTGAGR